MAPLVQLICDTYIHPSIKDPERMKRGDSSETVYSITGPNQNVPRDWQKALDSSSFKESFLRFLSTEWQRQEYGVILGQRQIYLALDHKCFRYTVRYGVIVREQVLALNSEHEEADTIIIYHLHKLTQEQPGLSISVRCDDTDVLLLLLYHVTCGNIQARVWMDAGKVFNNTRRYINISQIVMEESNPSLFDALLGFHAFTGCDFTAPFFGKGKQRPLQRMKKIPGSICCPRYASNCSRSCDVHPGVLCLCNVCTAKNGECEQSTLWYIRTYICPQKANFKSLTTNKGYQSNIAASLFRCVIKHN